jgi:outer membrane protein assembly factor BamB
MKHSAFRDHWCAAIAAAALILGLCAIPAQASPGDQSVAYQQDPGHDGHAGDVSLAVVPGQHWARTFPGAVSYPLIVNGMVFVTVAGSANTTLYALDQVTGATDWSAFVGGSRPWSGLTYDRGRVFTVSYGGLLTAFDAPTGAIDWAVQLHGQSAFTSPPTAAGGIVYDGGAGSGGTLYADAEDSGALLWSQSVENGDESSPAVAGGSVFVTYPGQSYAFDALTGALDWRQDLGVEGGGGRTPAVADGHVYVRDPDTSSAILSAADATTQAALGATRIPAIGGGDAYELAGTTLSAVANDGLGSIPWSFTGDNTLDTAPLVLSDAVIVGGSSGTLYARDPATGNPLWSLPVGAGIPAPDEQNVSQPLTGLGAANGTLVVPAGTTLAAYSETPAVAVPASVTAPSVDGDGFDGRQLAADVGTWSNAPTSYAHEWQLCNAAGASCADIAGGTGANITPDDTDLGSTLRVGVTASNASGASTEVFSPPSPVVAVPPPPPAPPVTTTTTTTPPPPPSVTTTTTAPRTPIVTITKPVIHPLPSKPTTTKPTAAVPAVPTVTAPKHFHLRNLEKYGLAITVHCFEACKIGAIMGTDDQAASRWGSRSRTLTRAGKVVLTVHLKARPTSRARVLDAFVTITEPGRQRLEYRMLYRITH